MHCPQSPAKRPHAFTLLELLVTISIIAIVAGLLLPALARSKKKVTKVHCVSNQHQIGIGYQLYVDDHNDYYPVQKDWAASGGTNGKYDTFVAESDRPLNQYVKALESFRCPNDKGDRLRSTANCFLQYGNSYLVQFQHDSFRVRHVAGDANAAAGSYAATPIKSSEISRSPVNKIIQGDWPWHANRGNVDPKSIWHNDQGQSRFNMLMGDGHVEYFLFPEEMANWTFHPKPDPNFTWW